MAFLQQVTGVPSAMSARTCTQGDTKLVNPDFTIPQNKKPGKFLPGLKSL
jgi:hypothetical protein